MKIKLELINGESFTMPRDRREFRKIIRDIIAAGGIRSNDDDMFIPYHSIVKFEVIQ